MRSGYGKWTYSNKAYYEGEFENDFKHGKEMKFLRMAISMRDSIMREKRLVGCMWRLLLGRKKRLRLRSRKRLRMKKKLKKSKLRPLDPG